MSSEIATFSSLSFAAQPGYICRREIEAGTLILVLPAWTVVDASFALVTPYRLGVPRGFRALLNLLAPGLPKALWVDYLA